MPNSDCKAIAQFRVPPHQLQVKARQALRLTRVEHFAKVPNLQAHKREVCTHSMSSNIIQHMTEKANPITILPNLAQVLKGQGMNL